MSNKSNKDTIAAFIEDSATLHYEVAKSDIPKQIAKIADLSANAIIRGNKIMFCGNGGSAADAQHLAAELVVRLTSSLDRIALPGLSLALDSSSMTACANDYEFDIFYQRGVEALGCSGDVLLAISTSGNSVNIIKAIEAAKSKNILTVGFTGANQSTNKIFDLADYTVTVPSIVTARIQELHICIGHAYIAGIEVALQQKKYI